MYLSIEEQKGRESTQESKNSTDAKTFMGLRLSMNRQLQKEKLNQPIRLSDYRDNIIRPCEALK